MKYYLLRSLEAGFRWEEVDERVFKSHRTAVVSPSNVTSRYTGNFLIVNDDATYNINVMGLPMEQLQIIARILSVQPKAEAGKPGWYDSPETVCFKGLKGSLTLYNLYSGEEWSLAKKKTATTLKEAA